MTAPAKAHLAAPRELAIEPRTGAPVLVANVRPLSDFEPESVSWLWHHRIPFGKITILEGAPDVGKSHLTLALAALVSVGARLPDGGAVERGNVVLVTCEDGLADTVRPRLDAAGGDPDSVFVLSGFEKNGGEEMLPVIPDDVPAIRKVVEEVEAKLLIIDPLTAYLGEKVNAHRDHDVRRALAPLQRMAEETGCAVLVIRHLRKGATGDAISAGGGSIGFTGLARCVLLAAKDPDDQSRRVLAWTKNNLAPTQSSLAYRLHSGGGEWAHVVWEGVSRYDANSLLEAARPDEEKGKTDQAVDWLLEYLTGGAMPAAEVKRAGRVHGFSDRTIERARERAGVTWERIGFGKDSKVEWRLPFAVSTEASPKDPPVGEYGSANGAKSFNGNGSASSPAALASTEPGSVGANVGGHDLTPDEIVAGIARENAARAHAAPAESALMRRVLGNLR